MPPRVNTMAFEAKQYMQEWESGWKKKDLSAAMRYVAEDVQFRDGIDPTLQHGKERYRETFEQYLKAFDLERMEVVASAQERDTAAVYVHVVARFAGSIPGPDGRTLTGRGQRVEFDVANFLWVRGDKIVRDESIFDTGRFFEQLGK